MDRFKTSLSATLLGMLLAVIAIGWMYRRDGKNLTGMQRATHTNPLTHGARAHGRALYSKASALVLDLHTSTLSYSWAFKDDLLQLFF